MIRLKNVINTHTITLEINRDSVKLYNEHTNHLIFQEDLIEVAFSNLKEKIFLLTKNHTIELNRSLNNVFTSEKSRHVILGQSDQIFRTISLLFSLDIKIRDFDDAGRFINNFQITGTNISLKNDE